MIAAQVDAPLQGTVLEADPPELGPRDVLIEVKNAGICGTDLHIWHGSYALAQYPLVPGHEFSGVVAAVGLVTTSVRKDLPRLAPAVQVAAAGVSRRLATLQR